MKALVVLAAAALLGAPGAPAPTARPLAIIGHRGGRKLGPENTLATFRRAIELRLDYVEIDVRQTAGGELVIMHDSSVDRTTDGQGEVARLTLAQVRALDAGRKFGAAFAGEKVPTLEEVLSLCKGKIGIYFDHKAARVADCVAAVRKQGMEKSVVVYGGLATLREWKQLAPEIAVMPTLPAGSRTPDGVSRFHQEFASEYLEGRIELWDRPLVEAAHQAGCRVFLDSPDDPAAYKKAVEIGVDGLQVDDPAALQAFLRPGAPVSTSAFFPGAG